jgi:hypothetical protein
MAIDIRATVTCGLGPVIQANIADDYLQGSGLIKTRGSAELKGSSLPAIGTTVTFTYTKAGGSGDTIPRSLRVLSATVDPYRKTTKVELGCPLTFFANRKPPTTNPNSKEENATIPCYVYNYATLPISASYVLQQCADALGLTLSSNPLTNKFSVEEFDLSPGYVQVMSDLLVSENFFGIVRDGAVLEIFSFDAPAMTGPIITDADVIDLGPVGVGTLAGDSARVKYTTRKLKAPDNALVGTGGDPGWDPKRNWEHTETIGALTPITVNYQDSSGVTQSVTGYYAPYSASFSLYDGWDRLIETVSISKSAAADVNGTWASDRASVGASFVQDVYRVTHEKSTYRYVKDGEGLPSGASLLTAAQTLTTEELKVAMRDRLTADTDPASTCVVSGSSGRPAGSSEVIKTVTKTFISEMEVAGSLGVDTFKSADGAIMDLDGGAYILSSVSVVTFNKDIASGITQTVTDTYGLAAKTIGGQQGLASSADYVYDTTDATTARESLDQLLARAKELSYIGAETNIRTEREYGLKRRPSQEERNNTANSTEEPGESVTQTVWAVGSVETEATQEFSLPYAPDDVISWTVGGGFTLTPSDAEEKARNYGRIQNRLLLGNRVALALQLDPMRLPDAPFDPIYVQAAGITGQFRLNGCSWAMTGDGVIASTDALYWGAVGADPGTTTSWVPLPPGMTASQLPATPAPD